MLKTVDEVQEGTRQKLAECKTESDAAKLVSDMGRFEEVSACDY
ncbi:MAG: hypothetical protein JWO71_3406 [Candidatus Acidoferrum typicum]|nr:hypothetical protein [Candidatus Acidoferrum typicum]